MCPVVGSASPCRRCSFVSLLWGLTDVLSRALDAELCRSGGAVQVVGVERGERGERRGLEDHTITAWGASHGVP